MPGLSGRLTTFNQKNYHGELLAITPTETPFLTAIGGLSKGGGDTTSREFEWQYYDLRDADPARQRLEGADTPTAEARQRANITNVVEIHHEAIDVSYTAQAAREQYAGANMGGTPNPVTDELSWQRAREIEQKARDIEVTLLRGVYAKPSDNATPRKTRGIIEAARNPAGDAGGHPTNIAAAGKAFTVAASTDAVTSNAHGYADGDGVFLTGTLTGAAGLALDTVYYVRDSTTNTFKLAATYGGAAIDVTADGSGTVQKLTALDEASIVGALQQTWEDGGIRVQDTAAIMVNGWNKRRLSKVFVTDKNYQEQTRTVGGVRVQTIMTDFGELNVMLNRHVPAHKAVICSLEQCEPIFLRIPKKGVFFVEELAKVGASDKEQLYGEIGLKYGNPYAHHVITGTTVR